MQITPQQDSEDILPPTDDESTYTEIPDTQETANPPDAQPDAQTDIQDDAVKKDFLSSIISSIDSFWKAIFG